MNVLIEYFWNFILGSFIGFMCETIWCLIRWKKLESRKGLIYGHFIPIYGIATILISFFVEKFNITNYLLFFAITFLICSVVEYMSSLFQEKCFSTKSWDYSKMIGNINGRINLLYLIAWSALGIFWCDNYKKLISLITNLLEKTEFMNEITIICLIFMIYNCYISFIASYRQKLRRKGIEPRNKYEEWLDRKYDDNKMKKIYANAKYVNN